MRTKIAILTAATVLVSSMALYGAASVQAQINEAQPSSIIQKLAQRFGLNEDEVKSVFEEERAEKQNMMKQAKEDRLSALVSEGKITETQKELIISKMEEHRAAMETNRQELETWAEQNGIDPQYLMGMHKGKFKTRLPL